MARAISVKVAKDKVIKALEEKVANNKIIVKTNEEKRQAHTLALTEYSKSILKDFADKLEVHSVSTRWNGQVEVTYKKLGDFDVPEQPQLNLDRELGSWEQDEIENAIRILKMSDEEFVNATTMKQIASYL